MSSFEILKREIEECIIRANPATKGVLLYLLDFANGLDAVENNDELPPKE